MNLQNNLFNRGLIRFTDATNGDEFVFCWDNIQMITAVKHQSQWQYFSFSKPWQINWLKFHLLQTEDTFDGAQVIPFYIIPSMDNIKSCLIHIALRILEQEIPWPCNVAATSKQAIPHCFTAEMTMGSEGVAITLIIVNFGSATNVLRAFLGHPAWGQSHVYKPCNHSLHIRIVLFPHIDNLQWTRYDQVCQKNE